MRDAIQRAFGVLLLASFALGVAVPGLEDVPDGVIPTLLGGVLFLACARITLADRAQLSVAGVAGFYLVRFVAVPWLLYAGFAVVAPSLAVPALLFGLLPTGVTTTAITSILGGNPALALLTTVVSTGLAPFVIPMMLGWAGAEDVDLTGVSVTLGLLLFVPVGLYTGIARRSERLVGLLREQGGVVSVGLICTIAFLVAGGQRSRILEDPAGVVGLFALGLCLYAILYGLGLAIARRGPQRERVAWALVSGNNNIVLGLTVALLHLDGDAAVTFLAWDLAWIVGLSVIQPVLRRVDRAM